MEKLYAYKYKGRMQTIILTKQQLTNQLNSCCNPLKGVNKLSDYEIFELKSLGTPKLVTTVEF